MDFKDLQKYCLSKKGACEDFPFGPGVHVMKIGPKMFALLSQGENSPSISLKCEPELSGLLREQHDCIKPGYHLNKRHWNTIDSDGTLSIEEMQGLIDLSYNLVFKGLKKSERESIIYIC